MASGPATKKDRAAERRARAEAARKAAERAERRRRLLTFGGAAVVALAVVLVLVVVAIATRPAKAPTFDAPTDPVAAIRSAGLAVLPEEGQVLHIHDHLDVYVDGAKVAVPQGIGIAPGRGISPLHTHTGDGVIHVESPTKVDYTLGQFLKEWQVRVTSECIQTHCGGVTAYVNGKRVADPTAIVFKGHQEIALVVGNKPKKIPSSYQFPPGE